MWKENNLYYNIKYLLKLSFTKYIINLHAFIINVQASNYISLIIILGYGGQDNTTANRDNNPCYIFEI